MRITKTPPLARVRPWSVVQPRRWLLCWLVVLVGQACTGATPPSRSEQPDQYWRPVANQAGGMPSGHAGPYLASAVPLGTVRGPDGRDTLELMIEVGNRSASEARCVSSYQLESDVGDSTSPVITPSVTVAPGSAASTAALMLGGLADGYHKLHVVYACRDLSDGSTLGGDELLFLHVDGGRINIVDSDEWYRDSVINLARSGV